MSKPSTPKPAVTPHYNSLQISTVGRGKGVPLLYGTNKLSGDLIWTRDFYYYAYQNRSGGASGGKGFGAGSGGSASGSTTIYYFAALLYAICEGPISGIIAVRNGSNWTFFNGYWDPRVWPVVTSGNTPVPAQGGYEAYPLLSQLPGSPTSFSNQLPIWIQNTSLAQLAAYEANDMMNIQNGISPINNSGFMYDGTHFDHVPNTNVWESESMTGSIGLTFQAPPPYISSRYPSEAIPYSRVAYAFFPSFQMGQSASPPNPEFWVIGMGAYDVTGTITGTPVFDASPYVIIYDLLTDPVHGLGASGAYIDSMTQFNNFCVASGMFLSASINGQQQIQQIIQLITQQTVAETWWSESRLKAMPWYDQTVVGYGKTFTPSSTISYQLTNDHFLQSSSAGPLAMSRTAVFDTFNQFSTNFNNRAINYSTDTATIDDLGNQILYGIRPAPATQGQYIADATVAFVSCTLQMQKQLYSRRTFTFKLPYIFSLLEPFDIITITDTAAAIVALPCRVLSTKFNKDYTIDVQAQELPNSLYNYTPKNQQFSLASGLGVSIPPGSIQPPVIFTGPPRLTKGDLEVWVAVTGQTAAWGGCRIWMSTDNTTFQQWGELRGGGRYGAATSGLASYGGGNPDTTDTLYLQLYGTTQQILSVSAAQAAAGMTLLLLLGATTEIMSYQTATLAPPTFYQNVALRSMSYALSGLYRAQMGTVAGAHVAGEPFVILDGHVAQIPIDISMLGQTIYLKFTSFNAVGAMEQDISQVTSYSYTIGPGVSSPSGPTFASIVQNGTLLSFTWEEDESPEVTGYEIRVGTTSSIWNTAFPLIRTARGSHTVATVAPVGTWTFYIASFDALNTYSLLRPNQTFTVMPVYTLLQEVAFGGNPNAPTLPATARFCDWRGWQTGLVTFVGCFVHPTDYSLVPTDSAMASDGAGSSNWNSTTDTWDSSSTLWDATGGTGWDWVDQFAISPPATSSWTITQLNGLNALLGNTTMRVSAFVYPTLWGSAGTGSFGPAISFSAFPGWTSAVYLVNAVVHPTAYCLVPDSHHLASYHGTDNGWEWVDNFVDTPYMSPSAAFIFDTSPELHQHFPLIASFSASNNTGPGQFNSATQPTIGIYYSLDGSTWLQAALGVGQQTAFAVARYIQVVLTLDTTAGALNYATQLSGNISPGVGPNYPTVTPLIADSVDNVTYGAYQKTPGVFTNKEYVGLQVSWSNVGNAWPFAIGSLWNDFDGDATLQSGTVTYSTPTSPPSVFFNPLYRTVPHVTLEAGTGAPAGATVKATVLGISSFQAQMYDVSGNKISGTYVYTAIGI